MMIHTPTNTIVVRDTRGSMFLETDSIVRIEALSNYSTLFLADGRKITVSKVLKQFESLLNGYGFTRIHRSHLVNSSWIQLYHAGRGELRMKNNERIQVSRRKKREVSKVNRSMN
jgi:two-component system, LytTR family, response regulator